MIDVRLRPLADVRDVISRATVREGSSIPETLGGVTLRPAQRDVAARVFALLSLHGGAMLAEPVGLGKTYAALAAAAALNESLLIVAPAALRGMWTQALAACRMTATFVSHESLSRGVRPATTGSLVLVDEAHRFRTPTTRRYALLADIARRAKVLLVTATPVQNRRADLSAQLALFLGRAAVAMTDAALAEFVVRESSHGIGGQPALAGPHALSLGADDDCLDALLALPSPVPARDESFAETLMTYGLVHQWTSSRAALVASLERRRARGLALLAAVESGRRPTRKELSAWSFVGDSLQLAFAEIVVSPSDGAGAPDAAVVDALHRHDDGVAELLRRLRASSDPDVERAAVLRRIRQNHPGERIIAFCHYTETVNTLRSHLAADAGVAALTARGARVAGGRVSRDDVLVQFTPSPAAPRVRRGEHISLLITTDLLSEGLNLQEASVVVHLDLPWNPARLEQRVGRARRLGSRHRAVTVYTIAPPASADRLLGIDRRLREKVAIATRAVGASPPALPSLVLSGVTGRGLAEEAGLIAGELRTWSRAAETPGEGQGRQNPWQTHALVAAAHAELDGFLALVDDGRRPQLIASLGAGIETSSASVYRAIRACGPCEVQPSADRLATALAEIGEWTAARRGAAVVDIQSRATTGSRRESLTRIATTLSSTPRHGRSRLAPLVAAARSAATAPLSEGAERVLDEIARSEMSGEEWLRSLAEFGEIYARASNGDEGHATCGGVIALILLQAE